MSGKKAQAARWAQAASTLNRQLETEAYRFGDWRLVAKSDRELSIALGVLQSVAVAGCYEALRLDHDTDSCLRLLDEDGFGNICPRCKAVRALDAWKRRYLKEVTP